MGQRFVACDREQSFLMPPDVREWLPPRHLAWFVIDAVAEMDLDEFYAAYRVDGRSRPPYDPAMMGWIQLVVATPDVEESRRDAQKKPCFGSCHCSREARCWTSACWAQGTSGPLLGGDRSRGIKRKRCGGGGSLAEHWCPVVP
jgi:hypothetical protein